MGVNSSTLTWLDLVVLAIYFIVVIGSGFLFKDRFNNVRDYFAAGGRMIWWMAGFSAITSELSVFAFTASAGKYAQQGVFLLYANLLSIATLPILYWLGPRFRRLRVTTGMEAVRLRFGAGTEKLYSCLLIPLGIWGGGMGIHITGTFLSSACGVPPDTVVLVVGSFTVIMSALGGIWAVATSDLFQGGLSLFIMVVLLAYASTYPGVQQAGGLVESIPSRLLDVSRNTSPATFIIWVLAMTVVTLLSRLSLLHDGVKFLVARSEKDCRLMVTVILTISLMLAPLVALPAMISSNILGADAFATALASPDGVMSMVARQVLPAGLFGLLLAGVMAAAMNSMDNGLNRNAGYFVVNIYQRYLRPQASPEETITVSRLATLISGGGSILLAIGLNHYRDVGLFDFVIRSNALLAIPLMIPMALGLLFSRAPGWAGWSGLLVCVAVSWTLSSGWIIDMKPMLGLLGVENPSTQEIQDARIAVQIIGTVISGVIWFGVCLLMRTGRETARSVTLSAPSLAEPLPTTDFWTRWRTPLQGAAEEEDSFQQRNAGISLLVFGVCMGGLAPFFGSLHEGLLVLVLAMLFVLPGYLLWRRGRSASPTA